MVKAKKSLGQNFLQDASVLDQIINAADIHDTDTILEIGPGKGALTHQLLDRAKKVIAVELDDRLIPLLKDEYGTRNNFELIHQDALEYQPPAEPYKIVANIPYYITSPILNHFLMEQFQSGHPPQSLVLMVQKEVAEKIIAEDGRHSVLSLQVHLFGRAEWVCLVPKTAFDPVPKVDSAVIKITVDAEPKIKGDLKQIIWMLHISFAQKRKKLANNLAAALRMKAAEVRPLLEDAKIDTDARAESLTLKEWQSLLKTLEQRSMLPSSE